MLKRNGFMTIAGVAVVSALCSAAAAQEKVVEVRKVYIERPPRTVAIVETVKVASDTIQLYRDANFEDESVMVNVSAGPAGRAHELPGGMEDSLSSLRWSLPAGVLVIMYEDDGAKGEQIALWGSGQIDALSTFDFDNKASQWAWYYVGGGLEPTEVIVRGQALPVGSVAVTVPAAKDSITLYKSKNFEANTVSINPMAKAANELHRLPEDLPDSLTSMRWNLPPGVVVVFHQDAQGDKQQVAIWGNGQVADLDVWDFNDKASRWAWHYIGSPEVEVLGYVPPEPAVVVEKKVVVVGDKDALDVVGRAIVANELRVETTDLVARKNPLGEGTFVYVPRTVFNGDERHLVWLVVEDQPYVVSADAKLVTPSITTAAQAPEVAWANTGLDRLSAEPMSVKILFEKR